jgi:hypothetical protein
MANIELINFGPDGEERGFNIGAPVGHGGKNHKGDVMLLQAMFKYIHSYNDRVFSYGVLPPALPAVTGDFNHPTAKVIANYQNKWAHVVLRVDGLIHPASYENRILADRSSNRLMTITLLHLHACYAARNLGDADYTEAIPRLFPSLGAFIP